MSRGNNGGVKKQWGIWGRDIPEMGLGELILEMEWRN